jgi:hypothetical protein
LRASRTLATLDEVDAGDHVCQMLKRTDDVVDRGRAFVADGALHGDKVVIVGPAFHRGGEFAPLVLDPARLGGSLLAQTATVRLLCHTVDFFDAAGMSALADAARHLPDRKVILEGTNETVRLAWELSGFAVPDIPVVIAS